MNPIWVEILATNAQSALLPVGLLQNQFSPAEHSLLKFPYSGLDQVSQICSREKYIVMIHVNFEYV